MPRVVLPEHRQMLARLVAGGAGLTVAADSGDERLIGSVAALDPWELRGCRWEEWIGNGEEARRGREFVHEMLESPDKRGTTP